MWEACKQQYATFFRKKNIFQYITIICQLGCLQATKWMAYAWALCYEHNNLPFSQKESSTDQIMVRAKLHVW